MKLKWSKIVLLCGVAATVLVGLLFSEDAAMVTSKVTWIMFEISAAVDAYIQKNKVMAVLWIVLIPISLYGMCRS
ncbi:MAG: hypothetical protein KH028_07010 [Oscillospiraceae bacterium]|jgi:hypothetical protein|nr:hypothetical protein [Oscillospiraceae bacterium]